MPPTIPLSAYLLMALEESTKNKIKEQYPSSAQSIPGIENRKSESYLNPLNIPIPAAIGGAGLSFSDKSEITKFGDDIYGKLFKMGIDPDRFAEVHGGGNMMRSLEGSEVDAARHSLLGYMTATRPGQEPGQNEISELQFRERTPSFSQLGGSMIPNMTLGIVDNPFKPLTDSIGRQWFAQFDDDKSKRKTSAIRTQDLINNRFGANIVAPLFGSDVEGAKRFIESLVAEPGFEYYPGYKEGAPYPQYSGKGKDKAVNYSAQTLSQEPLVYSRYQRAGDLDFMPDRDYNNLEYWRAREFGLNKDEIPTAIALQEKIESLPNEYWEELRKMYEPLAEKFRTKKQSTGATQINSGVRINPDGSASATVDRRNK